MTLTGIAITGVQAIKFEMNAYCVQIAFAAHLKMACNGAVAAFFI